MQQRTYDVIAADVSTTNRATVVALSVKRLEVTLDKTWAPYVQATVTCVQPTGTDLTTIDPRNTMRVNFTLRETVDGVVTLRVFNLALRARRLSWVGAEMELAAASDEALAQDWGWLSDQPRPVPISTSPALASFAVQQIADSQTVIVDSDAPSVTFSSQPGQQPGQSAWDLALDGVESAGAWLYCDESRVWHYSKPDKQLGTQTRYLNDATAIIEVSDSTSRDDGSWADGVVIAYPDPSSTSPAFSYAGPSVPQKVKLIQRTSKRPATSGAARALAGLKNNGRSLEVEALAEVDTAPNQRWQVTYGDQVRSGLVQRVTFTMPDGTMRLTINDAT